MSVEVWAVIVSMRVSGSLVAHEEGKEDMDEPRPQVFRVPQGSTASVFDLVLKDEDGNVIDLTQLGTIDSVLFNASTREGTSVSLDRAASLVTNGSDGAIEYQFQSAEVGTARDLWFDIEVRYADGSKLISRRAILRVEARARVG